MSGECQMSEIDGFSDSAEAFEERKHFQRIVHAFKCYRLHSLQRIYKTQKFVNGMSEGHQKHLENYKKHLNNVQVAIDHNYEVVRMIVKDVAHMFENQDHSRDVKSLNQIRATNADMDKVQSVFKQLVREWSTEGEQERMLSFKPILDEIRLRFCVDGRDLRAVHILVPGAGLGRLAFEIAKEGFTCQGNEFSLFMLFASNFILNKCKVVNQYRIYPWVHQHYNHVRSEDQLASATFPDCNPSELMSEFSMAAGNFTEIYKEPDAWDCVATCFFLDTASNVVSYIETIFNILKPGGYWINLGPLLYHYADLPNEDSIEPSYEEVKAIILAVGFQMLKEELGVRTPYTQNSHSMMLYEYRSVFFVCCKPVVG